MIEMTNLLYAVLKSMQSQVGLSYFSASHRSTIKVVPDGLKLICKGWQYYIAEY